MVVMAGAQSFVPTILMIEDSKLDRGRVLCREKYGEVFRSDAWRDHFRMNGGPSQEMFDRYAMGAMFAAFVDALDRDDIDLATNNSETP